MKVFIVVLSLLSIIVLSCAGPQKDEKEFCKQLGARKWSSNYLETSLLPIFMTVPCVEKITLECVSQNDFATCIYKEAKVECSCKNLQY